MLSTLNLYANIIQETSDPDRRRVAIDSIQNTIKEAIICLKEISNNLSPHVLHNFGLTKAIRNFIASLRGMENFEFKIESNLTDRLEPKIEFSIYRAVVELINNSVKYSQADVISVSLLQEKNTLYVRYADNGKGFESDTILRYGKSMGLRNIQSRINSLNGTLDLKSRPGEGMSANIQINLK
jgi:signal transduction histidine kinase